MNNSQLMPINPQLEKLFFNLDSTNNRLEKEKAKTEASYKKVLTELQENNELLSKRLEKMIELISEKNQEVHELNKQLEAQKSESKLQLEILIRENKNLKTENREFQISLDQYEKEKLEEETFREKIKILFKNQENRTIASLKARSWIQCGYVTQPYKQSMKYLLSFINGIENL